MTPEEETRCLELITHAGMGRSEAYAALQAAKRGDFAAAEAHLAESERELGAAHTAQTRWLAGEAQGVGMAPSLLLVHAQDQLMTHDRRTLAHRQTHRPVPATGERLMPATALIINADDLGLSPGVTAGIVQAWAERAISESSVLANAPQLPEILRAAHACGLPVGVHLNLTFGGRCATPRRFRPSSPRTGRS